MTSMFFLMTSATFLMTPMFFLMISSTFLMTSTDAEGHLADAYRPKRASVSFDTCIRVIRYEPLSTPPTVAMTVRQWLGMMRK